MEETAMILEALVLEYVRGGCTHEDKALGIHKMPQGYALMRDADGLYYFWLCEDGRESAIHWNKWAVRRGAYYDKGKLTDCVDCQKVIVK